MTTSIKEVLKNTLTLGLPEAPGVELTEEEKKFAVSANVTNSTLFFFMDFLREKSTGRDTQVDRFTEQQPDYGAVLHGHDVQLGKEASDLQDVSSEALSSSSTPGVAEDKVRGNGRF